MDEKIIEKSTSQLMAERFARGVPTGAFSKSTAFEKGGEPLSSHASRKEFSESTPEEAQDAPALVPTETRQHKNKYSPETYKQFADFNKKYGIYIAPENMDAFLDDIIEMQKEGADRDSALMLTGQYGNSHV